MIKAPTIRRLAANDSYTFLMQELERIDEQILEPLSGTDWPRDMPVITGGGLIESISSIDVTYASTGKDDDNLFFDAANEIPVIQADMTKQVARTFNFAEYMSFTVTEKEKMASVGRDPETFLNKGIRLHCDKVIDRNRPVQQPAGHPHFRLARRRRHFHLAEQDCGRDPGRHQPGAECRMAG